MKRGYILEHLACFHTQIFYIGSMEMNIIVNTIYIVNIMELQEHHLKKYHIYTVMIGTGTIGMK